ncbi:hypothetical protein BC938DRAFT_471762 [Jimgerdemannia flammicorona]|uniref:Uncharacterized protein n=1 Tax=Jimgerdemannia flammicorona TaxID=994334 RepID=A0A433Q7F2_9FUNG|nr:hypothetical protein BC938DRAFT_471762 [Jimgerdemannia flammicorona]
MFSLLRQSLSLRPLINVVAKAPSCIKRLPSSPSAFRTPNLNRTPTYQHRVLMTTATNHTNGKPAQEKSLVPSERVAHFEGDVWSIFTPLAVETGAINLGQGFMNFLPPDFVLEAIREAVGRNESNQYRFVFSFVSGTLLGITATFPRS